jgi:SecD/SecF fusion protein
MVAAMLTIIGYSVNDKIVIFDRIRENRGRSDELRPSIINNSISQTLSRTMLTGFSVLMVVLIMYIFGGAGIHGFMYAMFIGTVVGTYSSIYVATPLLLAMYNRTARTVRPRPQPAMV